MIGMKKGIPMCRDCVPQQKHASINKKSPAAAGPLYNILRVPRKYPPWNSPPV